MPDCMLDSGEVGLAKALVVEGVVAAAAVAVVVAAAEGEEEEEACSRLVRKMAGTFVSENTPWA